MNMIQMLIGISHWKKRMKKLASQEPYTKEWWDEVIDSVEFMEGPAKKGFVNSFVSTMINF